MGNPANMRTNTISYGLAVSIVLVVAAIIILGGMSLMKTIQASRPETPKDKAEAAWEAIVKKNPMDSGSRLRLGYAYYQQAMDTKDKAEKKEYLKKAEEQYKESLKLNPRMVTPKYNLGLVYEAIGDVDKAVKVYEELYKIESGNNLATQRLGEIYLKQGKVDQAIEKLEKAVEIEKGAANFRVQLAQAYEKNGRTQDAIVQLEIALKYIPDYKPAQDMLKRLKKTGAQQPSTSKTN